MSQSIITNRNEAGKLLAEKLLKYKNKESTIILAIPRGGVPVGFSIAKALHLSLDIVLSKKIAHPYNAEFAIGSVCNDTVIMDPTSEVPMAYVESEISRIKKDLKDRYHHFSGEGKFTDVKDKIVILVDDGIATGNTVLATIKMLREKKPTSIIVAVPVLPMDNLGKIKNTADDLVYLFAPIYFPSVGSFYKEFTQIEDSEVKKLLAQNKIQQQSPIEEEDIYFNEDFLL